MLVSLNIALSSFTVEDWPPANYAAISANVAIAGIKGGET